MLVCVFFFPWVKALLHLPTPQRELLRIIPIRLATAKYRNSIPRHSRPPATPTTSIPAASESFTCGGNVIARHFIVVTWLGITHKPDIHSTTRLRPRSPAVARDGVFTYSSHLSSAKPLCSELQCQISSAATLSLPSSTTSHEQER